MQGTMARIALAFGRFGLACVLCLIAQQSFVDDRGKVVGSGDGSEEPVMGKNPTGYVRFLPEGRVFFILTGEGRRPASTDQQRAELLNTLVAYTGTYRIEGDKWITSVEVAWNPEWIGTEQAPSFKIEGNRLQVLTPGASCRIGPTRE
jgi:hypothetical protein